MSKFMCLVVCVVAALSNVEAFTEEDITAFNNNAKPFIEECSPVHGITKEQLVAAKEAGTAVNLPPCFLACVLKKEKMFNPQGMLQVDVVLSTLNRLIKNKEDLAHLEEVAKKCAAVNDIAVTDGEAGCQRAKLMFDCLRENKGEIPL